VSVADARFAKPIDAGLAIQLASEHELLVTIEEGVLAGGFGSAVWETLNDRGGPTPRMIRVGLPDRYVTHGAPELLYEEVGFTAERIAERVRDAMAPETARSAKKPRGGASTGGTQETEALAGA
jgi:1-deoxy-D-xylulose-5-phosphate synthase